MGLFKDFKEDFSQAVNELVPGGERPADNVAVNAKNENVDVKSELSKLDGLLDQVKEEPVKEAPKAAAPAPVVEEELVDDLELVAVISAAIAAYTGTSSDGFVVRSIKRSDRNKWKKA